MGTFWIPYPSPGETATHVIASTQVDHIRRNSEKGSPIRAYNFAFPGATAEDDLSIQFSQFKTSLRDATLNGENTTYCTCYVYHQENTVINS